MHSVRKLDRLYRKPLDDNVNDQLNKSHIIVVPSLRFSLKSFEILCFSCFMPFCLDKMLLILPMVLFYDCLLVIWCADQKRGSSDNTCDKFYAMDIFANLSKIELGVSSYNVQHLINVVEKRDKTWQNTIK